MSNPIYSRENSNLTLNPPKIGCFKNSSIPKLWWPTSHSEKIRVPVAVGVLSIVKPSPVRMRSLELGAELGVLEWSFPGSFGAIDQIWELLDELWDHHLGLKIEVEIRNQLLRIFRSSLGILVSGTACRKPWSFYLPNMEYLPSRLINYPHRTSFSYL